MSTLHDAVYRALKNVFDPCSVTTGSTVSIVDMGLVTAVEVTPGGVARIAVRTTTPMCTLVGSIAEAAEAEVLKVPGVTGAVVTPDPRPGWTEDAMTDEGRRLLAARRERSRREVPVVPREWERRAGTARKAG